MDLVVGMGEYIVSDKEDDIIKTFALASCVAVTAYSPVKKVAGMIHVVLPSPMNIKDQVERPGYFAETGIPIFMNKMCREHGCFKGELQIHIYGGADSIRDNDTFNIGRRNIKAVIATLSGMGLNAHKADLSGNDSRTLTMEVKTGTVKVSRQPIKI
jgi:chemotaxis protein CheD